MAPPAIGCELYACVPNHCASHTAPCFRPLHLLLSLPPGSLPEAELPDLVGGESYEWAAIGDLDAFFKRIYRCAKAQHWQLQAPAADLSRGQCLTEAAGH